MEHGVGTYRRSEIAVSEAPRHTINTRAVLLLYPTGSCHLVHSCLFQQSDRQGGLHELRQVWGPSGEGHFTSLYNGATHLGRVEWL